MKQFGRVLFIAASMLVFLLGLEQSMECQYGVASSLPATSQSISLATFCQGFVGCLQTSDFSRRVERQLFFWAAAHFGLPDHPCRTPPRFRYFQATLPVEQVKM